MHGFITPSHIGAWLVGIAERNERRSAVFITYGDVIASVTIGPEDLTIKYEDKILVEVEVKPTINSEEKLSGGKQELASQKKFRWKRHLPTRSASEVDCLMVVHDFGIVQPLPAPTIG